MLRGEAAGTQAAAFKAIQQSLSLVGGESQPPEPIRPDQSATFIHKDTNGTSRKPPVQESTHGGSDHAYLTRKRADAAKHAALASKLEWEFSPFHPSAGNPRRISAWDMHRLRAGYGPKGKRDPMAAAWLEIFTEAQKRAGVRFGKYRFKSKPGAPDPDACTITLTGKHIPDTIQRTLEWSAKRHGIPIPPGRSC